tara:strand:+ start:358 stop:735 length:378 start_codon:yes stop_codon:yes gene_type:complete
MSIKLLLLKSGEDIICDVAEMASSDDKNERRVLGYYLTKPCVVKMRNPNVLSEEQEGNAQKAGYEVSLFPWMPLSKDETIPIPADWLITLVEPVTKLKEMYIEDIVNGNQSNSTNNDSTRTDKSD